MIKWIDLTGKIFNRLTVIKHYGQDDKKHNLWECQCICGNIKITRGYKMRKLIIVAAFSSFFFAGSYVSESPYNIKNKS